MSKYCSDCTFLNTNNAKCDGIYKCSKIKDYTNACNEACDQFEKCYGRNWYEMQELYDLGKEAANKPDDTPIDIYVFVLILLLIVLGITKLFGY
jgi:hypothetical protein